MFKADKTKKKSQKEIQETITAEIIKAMEQNIKYDKPWIDDSFGSAINPITKNHYSGCNVIILWASMMNNSFTSPCFATFKQWKDAGGKVKKGSKGTVAIRVQQKTWKEKNETTGEEITKFGKRFFIHYHVFNLQQVDGVDQFAEEKKEKRKAIAKIDSAETLINSFPIKINYGGNRAVYFPSLDYINMPDPDQFKTAGYFYSVAFHELIHATGHIDRLDRDFKSKGTESYSKEELVAELGAVFVLNSLEIAKEETMENSKAYIQSWLKNLRSDPGYIFSAASKASRAATMILNRGRK